MIVGLPISVFKMSRPTGFQKGAARTLVPPSVTPLATTIGKNFVVPTHLLKMNIGYYTTKIKKYQ